MGGTRASGKEPGSSLFLSLLLSRRTLQNDYLRSTCDHSTLQEMHQLPCFGAQILVGGASAQSFSDRPRVWAHLPGNPFEVPPFEEAPVNPAFVELIDALAA